MKKSISKLLVANRGEIACRIVNTAKKLAIKTVAVYSDVDKNALNVRMCDEAYRIGPASSLESYLRQDRIIDVARKAECVAIHPGYGFLSENADFAELCNQNGLIFIGPPPTAIRDMGIKSTSKRIMSEAGVPVIMGYHGDEQSDERLMEEAENIGFPLMIKAVRGGGGKGMRIAEQRSDFLTQLHSAQRESLSAFGDEAVLLEKFITSPRHVEVQVFADMYGNCLYLFERDCSVQRRHQKIIEEAPAPEITAETRQNLGVAAVRAAKAVNYVGAGTVEFMYDPSDGTFYFMEMNTRLQVEHAVTEMITGLDLIEWQIKVAQGEELPLKQDDIKFKGHSVEVRIYAEDPYNGFLPSSGTIKYLSFPQPKENVRIETGVCEGDEVSVHYDPMIAKLIVWGENRRQAYAKLKENILNYRISGLSTNVEFLSTLCDHPTLLDGAVSTDFIEQHATEVLRLKDPDADILMQAALAKIASSVEKYNVAASGDPWVSEAGFRVNHCYSEDITLLRENKEFVIQVTYQGNDNYSLSIRNPPAQCNVSIEVTNDDRNKPMLLIYGEEKLLKSAFYMENDTMIHLFSKNGHYSFNVKVPKFDTDEVAKENSVDAVSPMPGVINRILVNVGDVVKAGDQLVVVIAMKMEHVIRSPKDGVIKRILYQVGQSVPKGMPLVEFENAL